jgi:hypothetical protein
MKRKMLAVLGGAILLVSFTACQQNDANSPVNAPHPPGGPEGGVVMPPGETQVVVPEFVAKQYKGVVLTIEDKVANKSEDVTVELGKSYTIPNSTVKIAVSDFLPDFKMEGTVITSVSESMNNPAVKVTVTEGDSEVFSSWLYSKFPAIHPFQHEKFGITLKDGVKKG